MHIDFTTLFSYRQYVNCPVRFCFDRKKYKVCDINSIYFEEDNYNRYVPLFQIDEEAINQEFINQLNDKQILHKYSARKVCFEEFLQQYGLWERWWSFYRNKINMVAQQWCNEYAIKYIPQEF